MKKLLIFFIVFFVSCSTPKKCCAQFSYKGYDYNIKNILSEQLKFSTIYGAVNGGTSVSDNKRYSVTSGILEETIIETPYD